jgi:tryptophan synthase beta chain
MKGLPDKSGYFGDYGGRFVPETLINALTGLEDAYAEFRKDRAVRGELDGLFRDYAGRPTPIYRAGNLSRITGAEIFLKREDLLHTGAHKLNNTLGQALLARYMGKKRVIAETGAGQHGVATATVAALMGMECSVYMGSVDMERQAPNVQRMKLLGAEVVPVETGSRTLKDAINEAMKDWVRNVRTTHYLMGSVVGPHPFPMLVRDFQSVIGEEARAQMKKQYGGDPDFVVACVGGGSNAAGIFAGFAGKSKAALIGVEAGGRGPKPGDHSAKLGRGRQGILHGCVTYLLQDAECQVLPVHSVSAGLDYPAVGPEHCHFMDDAIATYGECGDRDALAACLALTRHEGILPALESSHALGYVMKHRKKFRGARVLINLSGRGDKDMNIIMREIKV